jgi:hypothetical protein
VAAQLEHTDKSSEPSCLSFKDCWKPVQRTLIHDHNGSHGAVFVHEGSLWEAMFEYDTETGLNYRSHRELYRSSADRRDDCAGEYLSKTH